MQKTYIIGAAALLILVGGVAVWAIELRGTTETTSAERMPETNDPFELAEYYFNADEDPEGPYDLKKARHYYEQAIAASSTAHDTAWYQLGRIDFLESKFGAAIYKFNKQIEKFGTALPQVHYMLGLTYAYRAKETGSADDWKNAEQQFLTFIPYREGSPWARTDLAWIYFAQGKYEQMLPILEKGLEYEPESPWLLNMYGLALLNTGERAAAHEVFESAHAAAQELTPEEWGRAYPGNRPEDWSTGLDSFLEAIEKNITLTKSE